VHLIFASITDDAHRIRPAFVWRVLRALIDLLQIRTAR